MNENECVITVLCFVWEGLEHPGISWQSGAVSSGSNIHELGKYYNCNYCVSPERAKSTNIGRSPMKINPLANQALKGRDNLLHL